MKKIVLTAIVLCLCIVSGVMAQAPGDTLWTKCYGGPGSDKGAEVQLTSDGGYIITGRTSSFGAGAQDAYLIRTDEYGDTLWTKTYGGEDWDYAYSVKQTTDSGFIVVGGSKSFSGGDYDVYLIKTDANGDTLWTRTYGGTDLEYGSSVQLTSDGGYIIIGVTMSFGAGDRDFYLIKTDVNGDILWTQTYGGTDSDEGYSVQLTSDGGYIIVGETCSYGVPTGTADVWLIKTDADGNLLWSQTYGGSLTDFGSSVQLTSDDGYIIAGGTWSYGAGYTDAYLIKTDADGDTLWTQTYGNTMYDTAYSIRQTADEGYIFTGDYGYADFTNDVWIVKTDASGNTIWEEMYGEAGGWNYDCGASIQITSDYNYIIAGQTYSYGAGDWDFYALKIAGDGEPLYPPGYVEVDPYTGLLTCVVATFFEDFESYTAGEYLALQSDDWITWSGTVGGPDDVMVVDELSYNGNNSIKIEGLDDDILHLFGNVTTGICNIRHYQYLEPGYGGYFNLLHEFTGDRDRTEWALEVYFASDGSGYINAGGLNAATFTYTPGFWVKCKTMVDLDNDWAKLWIEGNLVHEWQWSLQYTGVAGMNMLGAIDFWAGATAGDLVMYYVDNFKYNFYSTSDDLLGYNIYLDGVFVAFTSELFWQYAGLVIGQTYIAGVSAVYEGGQSEIIEAQFTFLGTPVFPPENLVATLYDYNDVYLEWEQPIGQCGARMLLGYNVYRNGDMIAYLNDPNILTYDDLALNGGTYEYWVTAIYDNGESGPSNAEEVTVILYPPQNLVAVVQGFNNVFLSWDVPSERDILYYKMYRNDDLIASNISSTFYLDVGLFAGIYTYKVAVVYGGGWIIFSNDVTVTVDAEGIPLPLVTELSGNYPNPFNPETTISFSTTESTENTEICIYNLKGQKVKTLINAIIPKGFHRIIWNGKDENNKPVSSGIYFYKMDTGKYSSSKKMILMK